MGVGSETRFAPGNGTDAPPAKECVTDQPRRDATRSFEFGNSREERVPRVGRADLTRALFPIQRQRVGPQLLTPELHLKLYPKRLSLLIEGGGVSLLTERAGDLRRHALRRVDIGLHFDERDGTCRELPVGMKD